MAAAMPAVELFTTSILSNHKVRHRHERYIAVFTAKKVDYVYHDMASDEEAKKRFRRKALDQQIPNILVHNEWRGTFEEFEESVEFGELDLFLKIDPSKVAAAPSVAAQPLPPSSDSEPSSASSSAAPTAPRRSSITPPRRKPVPPAPSVMPRMAPVGSGAGPRRDSASDLLASVDLDKLKLTDADIESLLEEAEPLKAKAAHQATAKAPKSSTLYPGEQASTQEVKRTYFPSENAGVRPLRLPKMGNSPSPSVASTSAAASSSSSSSSASPNPSYVARYSASQNSTRALAAEASASASGRNFSAREVRSGLDSGRQLQEVLGDYTAGSSLGVSAAASSVDALFEELGLGGDVTMSEKEVEAFMADGVVPEGLESGGSRIGKGKSKAGKARKEEAAKGVAAQARDLAADRRASAQLAKERKERKASLSGSETLRTPPAEPLPTRSADELSVVPEAVPEISDKTKEMLEKAREKRASRVVGLLVDALQSAPETPANSTEAALPSEVRASLHKGKGREIEFTDAQPSTEDPQIATGPVVTASARAEPPMVAPSGPGAEEAADAQADFSGYGPGRAASLPSEAAADPQIDAKSVHEFTAGATSASQESSAAAGPLGMPLMAVDETLEPIVDKSERSSNARTSKTSSAALDETLEIVFEDDATDAKTGIEASAPPKAEDATQTQQREALPLAPAPSQETAAVSVDTAAAAQGLPTVPTEATEAVEEEEKLDHLLARLQTLGKSMGSGLSGEADASLAPPAPIAKSPPDASDAQPTLTREASLPRKPRERDTSSNSSSSRRALDAQRTTIYPATISPSSSFSGSLPSTQATPRSPPGAKEGPTSPSAANFASPPPPTPPTPNGSGSGSTSKSPKLKGKLSRIRSFGSIRRSASSSSNLSSQQQQQQQQQHSPSSPRQAVPEVPSLANVAGMSANANASVIAGANGAGEPPERSWRLERTLSQVLRDADAALGEDAELDSYDGDANGNSGSGAGSRDYRQSVLMPDDGLGEAEIPH